MADGTPAEFAGWDKLAVPQGQEPPGWKNLMTTNSETPTVQAGGIEGLPAGAVLKPIAPSPQNGQIEGLPAGAVLKPIGGSTLPADVAARHARSREGTEAQVGTPTNPIGETGLTGIATGVGKGEARTIAGAESLVNKVLPNSAQLPKPTVEPTHGITEGLGNLAEGGLEWAAAEGPLEYFLRVAGKAPQVLKLIEENPRAAALITNLAKSKTLTAGAKAAAIGGAQGAVKGAATGQTKAEAEGGASGGFLGGASGRLLAGATPEETAEAAKLGAKVPKALGGLFEKLGVDLPYETAMTKAGRPYVAEHNWQQAMEIAKPRIAEFDKSKVKSLGDFVDMLGQEAQKIRQKDFQPYLDKYGSVMASLKPVGDRIRAAITEEMSDLEPKEAEEIKDFASKFDGQMTLEKAEKRLQFANKQLTGYYRAGKRDARGMLLTNGSIAKYEAAADGLRDLIYGRVKDLERAPSEAGTADLAKAQKEYGAFKDLERVFEKRATVAERQSPISLYKMMSALESVGMLLSGNPTAAAGAALPLAVGAAATKINSPEFIAKQAISAAKPESATKAAVKAGVKEAVRKGTPAVTGVTGEQVGEQLSQPSASPSE